MADASGNGAGNEASLHRLTLANSSSSFDQQQQGQHHPQQQQVRRSSAVNFDRAASELIGRHSHQQQQVYVQAVGSHHFSASSADIIAAPGASSANQSELRHQQQQQPQEQIRRNSAQMTDQSFYYYQQQQQQQQPKQQHSQVQESQTQFSAPTCKPQQANNSISASANEPLEVATCANSLARRNSAAAAATCDTDSQVAAAMYNNGVGATTTGNHQQRQAAHMKDDIDIVFNRLMALEAFRKLHPTVIRNLCSYASIERIDKGVIVFRQGDDAINWYALLEGSVDVKVAQSGGQKDGVTLCTLGVGTTFGASVMPGKSHSVSVVTSDDCTLLRVRRADFQEIFNEQSHLINDVESSPFCSFTSLNRHSSSTSSSANSICRGGGRRASSRAKDPTTSGPAVVDSTASPSDAVAADELNLDSIDSNELSSHLMRAGWALRTLILEQSPQMIQNRRVQPIHRHHHQNQHPRHHERGQLVSAASSSQLLISSQQQQQQQQQTKSSSTGRKVANYVASSFMRGGSSYLSSKHTPARQMPFSGPTQHQANNSGPLFTSSSFDADLAQFATSSNNNNNNKATQQHASGSGPAGEQRILFRRCMLGSEMVDWLMRVSEHQASVRAARFPASSRLQAVSMWQVLLEQGIVFAFTDSAADGASSTTSSGSGSGSSGSAAGPTTTTATTQQQQQCCQFQFCDDPQAYYKFWFDRDGTKQTETATVARPSESELELAHESIWWALKLLAKMAPDACFRLILGKRPYERSGEEVDIVFEELQHLKALSHLTNSVKKELAACVSSEHHAKQNTVIFNQGDPGHCWYIILRGSVNVVIVGKGVVCTLHEGDDFGKLALVNDAPRAATIVTNEPNCFFLRVEQLDFDRILRDVEANTVRLKEHGKEVLILQKVPAKEPPLPPAPSGPPDPQAAQQSTAGYGQAGGGQPTAPATLASQAHSVQTPQQQQQQQGAADREGGLASSALKYTVMAGTGEKMLEHLLETRIEGRTQICPLLTGKSGLVQHDQVSGYIQCHGDNFLEDFILTHKIFMPTTNLCNELLKQYQCQTTKYTKASAASKQQQQQAAAAAVATTTTGAPGEHTSSLDDEYLVAKKRRVVKFIRCWMLITREHFFQQQPIQSFLMTMHQKIKQDAARFTSLQPELKAVARILELHLEEDLGNRHKGVQRWIDDVYGNILPMRRHSGAWDLPAGASQHGADHFLASLHMRRFEIKPCTIQPEDEVVLRVYCADHSFATLKVRVDEKAGEIKLMAARKLNLSDKEPILVHVKSNGERTIYNDLECNISTSLLVNGRIFVCPLDHIDAISPLPEQDPFQEVYQGLIHQQQQLQQQQLLQSELVSAGSNGYANANDAKHHQQQQSAATTTQSQSDTNPQQVAPTSGAPINSHLLNSTPVVYADIKTQMSFSVSKLEEFSSRDVAYCLTQLAWSLLKSMHEFELIYTVFGRHNFKQQITANLNVFLRHFNEIQYWVVTQICLSTSLSKRVQIMRKFIKIAAHCKELQNLNAFLAIIMGLSNMAVARLTQTWERLKLKKTFSQFESLIDPSRNHRNYRIFLSKLEPPIIPFMPLLLKDMTFAHEGNKTYLENGLINFEKMQMVAQTLRTIRYCKSRPMKLDSSAIKFKGSIRSIELFFRDLKVIDNQRTLTQMSHQLEHKIK